MAITMAITDPLIIIIITVMMVIRIITEDAEQATGHQAEPEEEVAQEQILTDTKPADEVNPLLVIDMNLL